MATQRLIIATIAGKYAEIVVEQFNSWRSVPAPAAIDRFCAALRDNGQALPIVYFCEWIDPWLMGNLVPGPNSVEGHRYQTTCLSKVEATEWAAQCGHQFSEQEWLASRLLEAAHIWCGEGTSAIIVIREVLGPSATDEEAEASWDKAPKWLQSLGIA